MTRVFHNEDTDPQALALETVAVVGYGVQGRALLYPLVFRALEIAFDMLVEAGYPPEAALMELHGSGELGQVLEAAGREGLYAMIRSHASPACQVGIAHHWHDAIGPEAEARRRIQAVLDSIRDGRFARHLFEQQERDYPELKGWARAQ